MPACVATEAHASNQAYTLNLTHQDTFSLPVQHCRYLMKSKFERTSKGDSVENAMGGLPADRFSVPLSYSPMLNSE
ncbi:hypothetical protein CEXT_623921 [Caerostris extrusa]|uniref:Uncharacterized protein n=1 Tax=Caerostris extrusa TaxID=172846 RepID=A0AAV4MFJ7_CAEEX|nr:hypothetical protein CEXT_623921 [Caerostris extrusa]